MNPQPMMIGADRAVLVPARFGVYLGFLLRQDAARRSAEARRELLDLARVLDASGRAELAELAARSAGSAAGTGAGGSVGGAALSSHDVAERTGLKGRSVRKAAAAGRLRGSQFGGRWVFHQVDVDEWIQARRAS